MTHPSFFCSAALNSPQYLGSCWDQQIPVRCHPRPGCPQPGEVARLAAAAPGPHTLFLHCGFDPAPTPPAPTPPPPHPVPLLCNYKVWVRLFTFSTPCRVCYRIIQLTSKITTLHHSSLKRNHYLHSLKKKKKGNNDSLSSQKCTQNCRIKTLTWISLF